MPAKPAEPKAAPAAPAPRWRRVLCHPKVVVALLILGGLPFLQKLSSKSDAELAEQPAYLVDRAKVVLEDRPPYVPVDLLERTWELAELPEQFSALEPGLAEKIGKALEQSPWVRSVRKVAITYPTQISIAVEFRRPVALVRSAEGYYPVDRDGILLPPTDFSVASLPKYPVIDRVRTLPQGPAGTHWGDLAVWGAARLVELLVPEGDLQKYWSRYSFLAIQVDGSADLATATADQMQQLRYRILTRNGSEIIWGVAPGVPDPTEPDADTKLKRLSVYFRDFGSLSSDQEPVELDLRRWKEIARRPLLLDVDSLQR